MTGRRLRELCLSMPGATSDFPFDEVTEAFRVGGRIFALYFGGQPRPVEVNLKCDPALAAELRAAYPEVQPGWHMNHEHWNTLRVDGSLPPAKVAWLVRHSWDCVVDGLPRRTREALRAKDRGGKR